MSNTNYFQFSSTNFSATFIQPLQKCSFSSVKQSSKNSMQKNINKCNKRKIVDNNSFPYILQQRKSVQIIQVNANIQKLIQTNSNHFYKQQILQSQALMPERHNNKILRKLRQIDAQPYTIQLNYKNKHHFKSATGGFISLIFYIASAIVVGLNIYFMIAQNEIIFDQLEVKNNLSPIGINNERFGLLLIGLKNQSQFNLTIKDLETYGLQVSTQQNLGDHKHYYPAIQGYNTSQYDFSSYLFFNQSCPFYLEGSSKLLTDHAYHRVGLVLKNISDKINNTHQKLDSLRVKFVFINNVVSPKSYQPVISTKTRVFFIRNDLPLASHQTQIMDLFFRKLEVYTDKGKFFNSKDQYHQYVFYDQEVQNSVYTTNDVEDDRLVVIKLKRSLYTIQYDRHYKKIATYLAETFGVIGLISLIFLLYKGYNRWCFTQNQLIPPSHSKKSNIFNYYYSMLRNLKRMTITSQVYDQFEHNLDIHKILQRLDDFERRLRALQGRSNINYTQDYEPQFARKKSNKKTPLLQTQY